MFGGKNETTARSGPQAVPAPTPLGRKGGAFSVLGADVVITGNISASADLHVDGRVDGDVTCAALVQGTQGIIAGAIIAESARIAGTVDGSVRARELVIERGARISGDVEYESITIETGGHVDGRLRPLSAGMAGVVKLIGTQEEAA